MRTSFLGAILAVAGVTFAQSGLSDCAQQCVLKFTQGSQIGNCGNLDAKCICSSASFLSDIACCLAASCNAADQAAAVVYAKQICITQGVTVPDTVSCSTASATASATTGSASSAASAATSVASAVTSAASVSSAVAASTTSSPGSATSAASASASATKNAGIQNTAGAGMSLAGGFAVIVALL